MAAKLSLDPELIERALRKLEWDQSFDTKVERSRR